MPGPLRRFRSCRAMQDGAIVAVILTGVIVAKGMDVSVENGCVFVVTIDVSVEEGRVFVVTMGVSVEDSGVAVITIVVGWSGRMQAVMKRIINPRYRRISCENRTRL